MNAKTLKALKGSIKKWEGIVNGTVIDIGSNNCPLCKLFCRQGCVGCPVFESTGEDECEETPYMNYMFEGGSLYDAKRELKFLKSLLPKIKTKTKTKKD